MALSVVKAEVDPKESKPPAFETKMWNGDEISCWIGSSMYYIAMKLKNDTIRITDQHLKPLKYGELLSHLDGDNPKVYIEWGQNTGQYLYFDLLSIITKVKAVSFNTSILKYNAQNKECLQPAFDESVALESVLSNEDILLLSPIRSYVQYYTKMGEYHGKHILYLGPKPTKEFINHCNVKHLYNCCTHSNDEDILKLPDVVEMVFNVAAWCYQVIDDDSDDDSDDDDDDENEENEDEKSDKYTGSIKQYDEEYLLKLQYEYLDKKIDLIDQWLQKGNVLIHCLAGAHRSPFITGCYEYKYGHLGGKKPEEVYKWLKGKRDIVQELGFDVKMKEYFEYLNNKEAQ